MNYSRITIAASILMITAGLTLGSIAFFEQSPSPKKAALKTRIKTASVRNVYDLPLSPSVKPFKQTKNPMRITIPSVNINLPVTPGTVNNNVWTLSDNSASYLVGSGEIGTTDNAVIYGHAKKRIFGRLEKIKKGDVVEVKSNNIKYKYVVKETKVVEPTQTNILNSTPDATLTLFTCTGKTYTEKRFVAVAKLSK